MSEYIDRKKLLEELNQAPAYFDNGDIRYGIDIAFSEVLKQPIADVVSVVRCKDCKYFEIDEEDELGECKCGYITVSYNGALYPHRTDYCSYGERKKE